MNISKKRISPAFKVFLGAFFISFAPILVKGVNTGPTLTGFFRCALGAILFFIWALLKNYHSPQIIRPLSNKFIFLMIAAGFALGLDFFVWHKSIIYTGAGISTILANTQIFHVTLLGIIFYKEWPTQKFLLAVPMAFLGIYFLVSQGAPDTLTEKFYTGVALGLSTGVFYTAFILLLKKIQISHSHISTQFKLGFMLLFSTLTLFCLTIYEDAWLWPLASKDIVLILLLSIFPQVLGWFFIMKNLPHLPVSKAGLVLLSQPVLSTIFGNLVYGESFSELQLIGGFLTLFAIYLGNTSKMKETKIQKQKVETNI